MDQCEPSSGQLQKIGTGLPWPGEMSDEVPSSWSGKTDYTKRLIQQVEFMEEAEKMLRDRLRHILLPEKADSSGTPDAMPEVSGVQQDVIVATTRLEDVRLRLHALMDRVDL